ncbi:MAG: tRNA dihydrouridine synthase DusB [Candidatus Cloacimonadaceae bacterium]
MNSTDFLTKGKLWLAPLAGYTDRPFRRICKEWGADVVVSEMVSADGIVHKQRQTLAYLEFTQEERPFGVQLFGSNSGVMAKAAETVLSYQPDFIDINMGCPVKKVIKRGAGGALMNDLPSAVQIVKEVRNALPEGFPLSVKFRSGSDISHLNFLEFGLAMQEAGADFVTLHPRTVKQVFSGVSNWEHITLLKKQLAIPVIGNGDIKNVEDALQMMSETGCDSIMLGRGALGQPWIFRQIKAALTQDKSIEITPENRLDTVLKLIDYALEVKPERLVVREIRSQLCFYTKGITGSARLRDAINHTESITDLKKLLTNAFRE